MKTESTSKIICVATVVAAAVLLSASTRADDKSAATYKAKCATCHGADGKGDTPAGKSTKVRSFADPEVVKRATTISPGSSKRAKRRCPAMARA
jgi:cytochrome c6